MPVAASVSVSTKTLPVQPAAAQSSQSHVVDALEARLRSVETELHELRQAKKTSVKKPNHASAPVEQFNSKQAKSLAEVRNSTEKSHSALESLAHVVTSEKWEMKESSSTEHKSAWGMASLLSEGSSLVEKIEAVGQQKFAAMKSMFEGSNATVVTNSSRKGQHGANKTVQSKAVSSKKKEQDAVAVHMASSKVNAPHKAISFSKAENATTAAKAAADRLKRMVQSSHSKQNSLNDAKHHTGLIQKAVDDDEDSAALRLGKIKHKAKATALTSITVQSNTSMTCEGNCNGHGTCEPSGQCACEAMWIGATCDMPRCPRDCSGRGMCVDAQCVCEGGFYGSYCQHKRCANDCSSQGYCFQGRCQ
jgi:hypothetical protein